MFRFGFLALCVAVALPLSTARAEYRVALLIGNQTSPHETIAGGDTELQRVARSLARYGFQCRVVENPANENGLRDAIEGFAGTTPVRSTALLYYQGPTTDGPSLLAADMRGKYGLDRALTALSGRGGSLLNLVFVDSPQAVEFSAELPENVQLTIGTTESLLEKLAAKPEFIAAMASSGATRTSLAAAAALAVPATPVVLRPLREREARERSWGAAGPAPSRPGVPVPGSAWARAPRAAPCRATAAWTICGTLRALDGSSSRRAHPPWFRWWWTPACR